jgi:biopolymer transport protein ExbD
VYVESEKTPASPEQLTEAMRNAVAQGKRVMVKADKDTEYSHVRPVLDRASKAKLKGVQLAAEEQKK